MERRSFIKAILGGVAAAVAAAELDPERLLWTPGARTFFIPQHDIAIPNIRQATLAEQAEITGQHLLRIKYRGYCPFDGVGDDKTAEKLIVISELEFAKVASTAFEGKAIDVHFDDGLQVVGVSSRTPLSQIKQMAADANVVNAKKVADMNRFRAKFTSSEWDRWKTHRVVTEDSSPVIRL